MFVWKVGIPWDEAGWDVVYQFLAVAETEADLKAMLDPFREYIEKEHLPHFAAFDLDWHELTVTKIGIALPDAVPGWFDYSTKMG